MEHLAPRPHCPAGSKNYRWRYGDTAETVASAYDTTVQAIRDMNPNLDFDRIAPGLLICVPTQSLSCPEGSLYTVEAGDSIASIARVFGITPGALMDQNPYVDPRTLKIGQILCVPGGLEAGRLKTMRVRFGQTIDDILRLNGICLADFEAANPGLDVYRMVPGQTYRLP